MGEERYVEEELSKAREALADAERLATSGGSDDGIVNRLYYAVFHAAQAVLYDRGIDPSSHAAVRNLFGEHVVLNGVATRDQGRLLTTLADLRQQADTDTTNWTWRRRRCAPGPGRSSTRWRMQWSQKRNPIVRRNSIAPLVAQTLSVGL